jgi:iron(III) transport system substrate-binding protein
MPRSPARPAAPRSPLVDVAWLQAHLDDTAVRVIDLRWYLAGKTGAEAYARGHIPGAVFVDLHHDLTGPVGPGRHPIPSPAQFERTLRAAGVSADTRVVVYDKLKVKREDVDTYEELAAPVNKGRVCTRSGAHPYNLSLFGAMVEHIGPQKTEAWLKGLVDNMARAPKGGDTDQIRAVASGECGVVLTNTYYLARLMRSAKPEDKAVVDKVGVVFPNHNCWGTHLTIAGGAVAKHAKGVPAAVQFLEYLASPEAQNHFANGNNEWPAAQGVSFDNPALKAMTGGSFKSELVPISRVGMNQVAVQQMLDRVGFK